MKMKRVYEWFFPKDNYDEEHDKYVNILLNKNINYEHQLKCHPENYGLIVADGYEHYYDHIIYVRGGEEEKLLLPHEIDNNIIKLYKDGSIYVGSNRYSGKISHRTKSRLNYKFINLNYILKKKWKYKKNSDLRKVFEK